MKLKTIALTNILLIIGLLIIHVLMFDYPIPVIFSSIFVISVIYCSILWFLGLTRLIIPRHTKVYFFFYIFSLTLTTSSIILLFMIDYAANSNMGTNLALPYIIKYASQLTYLKNNLPVPPYIIYFFIITLISITFFIYLKAFPVITYNIDKLIVKIKENKLPLKESLYLFLSLAVIPFFIVIYQSTQTNIGEDMWDGEPITDLFLTNTHIVQTTNQDGTNSPIDLKAYYPVNKNIQDKPNIILIIADALRADHVSSYGYTRKTTPFLDKLITQDKAIKVDLAFSTCAESNCGILSTLSSRPYAEINPNNITLNRVLRDLGYDINLILSTDHTWAGLKEYYPPYDLFYDGNSAAGKYAITDDELVLDRLSRVKNYQKPTFFYFHLMSNHSSGIRKKQFAKYTPYKSPNDWFYRLPIISSLTNTNKITLETNFYDNGVITTDYYISQIFKQLSDKGYLKNSIVWIIADHGEAIGEHGLFGHINGLYNEETHIPMIIVDRRLDMYKERHFATQLDFAPTILDRLGIRAPKSWKGKSLLKKKSGTYITHHNIPDRKGSKAIIVKTTNNEIYKMLYNDTNNFTINGIFNLNKDIAEKHNLNNAKNKELVEKMTKYAKQNNRTKI